MRNIKQTPVAIAESLFRVSLGLQKFNKRLERLLGLSLVQWYLLRRLIQMPSTSAGVLAKDLGVHPGTLTPLLKRLRRKGMLFVEQDPFDSRRKNILISRAGRTKLVELEKSLFSMLEECGDRSISNIENLLDRLL